MQRYRDEPDDRLAVFFAPDSFLVLAIVQLGESLPFSGRLTCQDSLSYIDVLAGACSDRKNSEDCFVYEI